MTESKKYYREIGDGLMAVINVSPRYRVESPAVDISIDISLSDKYHPMYGSFSVRMDDDTGQSFGDAINAMLNLLHSEILLPLMVQSFINNEMAELNKYTADKVWSFGSRAKYITFAEAKNAR